MREIGSHKQNCGLPVAVNPRERVGAPGRVEAAAVKLTLDEADKSQQRQGLTPPSRTATVDSVPSREGEAGLAAVARRVHTM